MNNTKGSLLFCKQHTFSI